MYLYWSVKILLVLVLEFEEIFRARAIIVENDITKPLDKWFSSIFELDANKNLGWFGHKELQTVDIGKGIFESLHAERKTGSPGQLDFKFSTNMLSFVHENFTILMWGWFKPKNKTIFRDKWSFKTNVVIKNVARIIAVPSLNKSTCLVTRNFSWDQFTLEFENPGWYDQAKKNEEEELRQHIMPVLFSEKIDIILGLDNTNLNAAVQNLVQPRNKLLSIHPNLLDKQQQFHYLITKVPFYSFFLKRIVIANLSNLDSFRMQPSGDFFTHTLLVNDINGSMILDYESEKEAPLKLKFKIENLYVMKRQKTSCVVVQAEFWQITRAKSNVLLNSRQSQVLIRSLEYAIASSILPSIKVGKVCSIDKRWEEIKIANVSDWETVKKSYKGLIPFNDDV